MLPYLLTLIIVLNIGIGLTAVALIVRGMARRGWLPLAAAFPLAGQPVGPETRLRWVSVGDNRLGHKNVVVGGASAAGLSLRAPLLARFWHPPLLIPWSAVGPLQAEKRLLFGTRYTTAIRLPDGTAVPLRFEGAEFMALLQPWVRVVEAV